MFNQFDPTVKATSTFLKLLNVKVNDNTIDDTLQNHPDWPSLLCVGDSLNKWNVPNGAGRIDPVKIDELPVPFLAFTEDKEVPLAIVEQVTGSVITKRHRTYGKPVTEKREDFIKNWDGVYLIAEPNEHSGEANYERRKRRDLLTSLVPLAAIAAMAGISVLLLYKAIGNAGIPGTVTLAGMYVQALLVLLGFAVSVLLLWYETDKSNPLLQKVCTGITKGNCDAILTGKAAKVFSWLSWSEVGFFYFAGALLSLLFAGSNLLPVISLIAAFNVLAIPYPVFSVYYQWKVAKQWCVLCLAIQALLVAGVINITTTGLFGSLSSVTGSIIIQCFLAYIAPALIWFTVKPYILKLQEAKTTKREYLRIKFNTEIFETLLKKQKQISVSADGLGINLGNPEAPNTLVKVCNPYCGPCARSHPAVESLLSQHKNLQVKIIFACSNTAEDITAIPAKHFLSIAETQGEEKVKEALDKWYLSPKKNYDEFSLMHPIDKKEIASQDEKVESMKAWCKKMDVAFTPTFFLNGYKLPEYYNVNDLQYFLLD